MLPGSDSPAAALPAARAPEPGTASLPQGLRLGLSETGSVIRPLLVRALCSRARRVPRRHDAGYVTVTAPGPAVLPHLPRSQQVQVGAAQQLLPGMGPNSRGPITAY